MGMPHLRLMATIATPPQGVCLGAGSLPHFFKLLALSPFVSHLPKMTFSVPSRKDSMSVLRELLDKGKITPVIDRILPLSEVPEAMRYLQSGDARGKIIVIP